MTTRKEFISGSAAFFVSVAFADGKGLRRIRHFFGSFVEEFKMTLVAWRKRFFKKSSVLFMKWNRRAPYSCLQYLLLGGVAFRGCESGAGGLDFQ